MLNKIKDFYLAILDKIKKNRKNIYKLVVFIFLCIIVYYARIIFVTLRDLHLVWKLVNEFFSIILSWPMAIFALIIIFIYKFPKQIKNFLEHPYFKYKGFEVGRQQGDNIKKESDELLEQDIPLTPKEVARIDKIISDLLQENENQKKQKEDAQELLKHLFAESKFYEFSYLRLFLVNNSIRALLFFKASSTRENYLSNFHLRGQFIDYDAEKEKIFSILLSNSLINPNFNGLLLITDKGNKLLKFIENGRVY